MYSLLRMIWFCLRTCRLFARPAPKITSADVIGVWRLTRRPSTHWPNKQAVAEAEDEANSSHTGNESPPLFKVIAPRSQVRYFVLFYFPPFQGSFRSIPFVRSPPAQTSYLVCAIGTTTERGKGRGFRTVRCFLRSFAKNLNLSTTGQYIKKMVFVCTSLIVSFSL